jgi:hypothetical protein
LVHDECYQVMCSNFEFLGLRLKKKDLDQKIGCKVIKPILKMFGYNPPSSKNDIELEYYMREKLNEMLDKSEYGFKQDMDSHCFID